MERDGIESCKEDGDKVAAGPVEYLEEAMMMMVVVVVVVVVVVMGRGEGNDDR